MKLRSLLAIAAIVLYTSCGTPYQATSTGDSARTAFLVQYPNAINPEWTRYDVTIVPIEWDLTGWPVLDNTAYLVRFNQDNSDYYAWYDADGNWVGSSYLVTDYTTVPVAINTTVTSQYPGYTIMQINKEMQRDRVAYEVEMKNSDGTKRKVLIDQNGNVIKEKIKQ